MTGRPLAMRLFTVAVEVGPDFSAVGGSSRLAEIVGALLTIVLVLAVLMLLVCAAAWAIASSAGNYQTASRARAGLWTSIGTAVLAGAGIGWMNFLLDLGPRL
ncbi:MAG: DUF6112 family protein [Desertimonas sp.]